MLAIYCINIYKVYTLILFVEENTSMFSNIFNIEFSKTHFALYTCTYIIIEKKSKIKLLTKKNFNNK